MSHYTLLKWAAAAALTLAPVAALAHSSLVETETPLTPASSTTLAPLTGKAHTPHVLTSHHKAKTLVKHTHKVIKRHTRKPAVTLSAHKHKVSHLKSHSKLDKSTRTGSTM